MSNLLEQASLVLIPSGYAEDIVYSEIPLDGSGDMVFTRASNGTRINFDGLVEVCPWNLLTYSSDLSNGAWTGSNITKTTGQTDPNGGTTAATINPNDGTNAYLRIGSSVISGNSYTYSFYIKGSTNGQQLGLYTENGIDLNQAKTLTTSWQRFDVSGVATSTASTGLFILCGGAYGYTDAPFDVAFPQFNIGSTAKPYFPTTDRLNVPRLTYQNGGGGCPSLLLEKQSTNYFPYSQNISLWYAPADGVTLTSNTTDTVSPDGTNNASKIAIVSGSKRSYEITNSVAGVGTFSAYVKAGTSTSITLFTSSGSINIGYNLSTLAITTGSGTGTITSVGNGWYRITATNTLGASEVLQVLYTGTAGQTIYIWGFQVEASSYVTSYIFTNGASATRVADACSKTGISSLIGQTSGTILWDIQVDIASGPESILNLDAGSFANTIYLIKGTNSSLGVEMYASSILQSTFTLSSITAGRYKMAIGYANNNTAFFINGTQVGTTDTSCSVPAMSRLQMGSTIFGPSDGKVNQVILFPTRLSNSDLIALTTL